MLHFADHVMALANDWTKELSVGRLVRSLTLTPKILAEKFEFRNWYISDPLSLQTTAQSKQIYSTKVNNSKDNNSMSLTTWLKELFPGKPHWTANDMPDLTGKVVVVTGGNAGIGWEKTSIVGTIGYTSFSSAGKNDYGSIKYVPMKIGLRQYLFSKFVYLHGDLGVGRVKNDLYNNQSRFSGDIGAGVKFAGFEVQLDYDGFTRNNAEIPGYSSWIGMKAGFNLGL